MYSLNEVESIAKKAARGAGYPWGIAEEAGKAIRWLAERNLNGCQELARLLDLNFAEELGSHTPDCGSRIWSSSEDTCPLICGSALSDRANGLKLGSVVISNVQCPLILLPFCSNASKRINEPISLETNMFQAIVFGDRLNLVGQSGTKAVAVKVNMAEDAPPPLTKASRVQPELPDWETLNRFASKTYAPATEESRALGAGADISDRD